MRSMAVLQAQHSLLVLVCVKDLAVVAQVSAQRYSCCACVATAAAGVGIPLSHNCIFAPALMALCI